MEGAAAHLFPGGVCGGPGLARGGQHAGEVGQVCIDAAAKRAPVARAAQRRRGASARRQIAELYALHVHALHCWKSK